MIPDELEQRWILAQGWLAAEELAEERREQRRAGVGDLVAWLERRGLLSAAQLATLRLQRSRALELRKAAESDPRPADDLPDRAPELTDYALGAEIARGAMGAVFVGEQRSTGRACAVKFVLGQGAKERARFMREIEALIRLKHSNIVEIMDFGEHAGRPFYVMEKVEGEDLMSQLRGSLRSAGGPFDWPDAVDSLSPIADALRYCHEHDVVHRDVKPQNVLVEVETGRTVLADFGLMKGRPGSDSEALTQTGEIVGTPSFMAPEQFRSGGPLGEPGPPSDVWGFGATLYCLVTGTPPFLRPTVAEIFHAVLKSPAMPPSRLQPGVPSWLDELCLSCLEKSPDQRPTMAEVVWRLEEGLATDDEARPRASMRSWGALSLVCGLTALIFAFSKEPRALPPSLVLTQRPPALTGESSVVVEGRVRPLGARVEISGERLKVDARGAFAHRVELIDGRNRLLVSAPGLTLQRGVVVERDSAAPVIRLDFDAASGAPGQRLEGRVEDANFASLSLDGARVPVDAEGRFSLELPASLGKIELVARDVVGNVSVQSIRVAAPARPKAPLPEPEALIAGELDRRGVSAPRRARVRALFDLEAWRSASDETRGVALSWVSERLGAGYRSLGLETLATEGSVPLGRFIHEATGMEMRLIPGAVRRVRWWKNPEIGIAVEALERLAEPTTSPALLDFALRMPLFKGFKAKVCRPFDLDFDPSLAVAGLEELSEAEQAVRRRRSYAESRRICRYFVEQPEQMTLLRELFKSYAEHYAREHPCAFKDELILPFLLARDELSQEQWARCVPQQATRPTWAGPTLPAHGVSYEVAQGWLRAAGGGLRLPTRLEWQYASQGAGSGELSYELSLQARAREFWRSFSVGLSPAGGARNGFGFSHMLDNVCEWVEPIWVERARELFEGVPALDGNQGRAVLEGAPLMGGSIGHDLAARNDWYYQYRGRAEDAEVYGFRVALDLP